MNLDSCDTSKLQIFIMYSRASLPLPPASHVWFVINDHGTLSRYEGLDLRHRRSDGLDGYIFQDYFPPSVGMPVWITRKTPTWGAHTLSVIEGDQAERLAQVLRTSLHDYPHKHYRLLGPNSNTYAQWIINTAGLTHVKLPITAVGAGFGKV
jgi:hypothetical protein